MTFSYLLTTDIGWMRLTIPDRVEATALFSDEELQALRDAEGDKLRGAAAALELIAGDALMLVNIKAGDDSVSGSTTGTALLARAKSLRDQAAMLDDAAGSGWAIASWSVDDFSAREIIQSSILRGSV